MEFAIENACSGGKNFCLCLAVWSFVGSAFTDGNLASGDEISDAKGDWLAREDMEAGYNLLLSRVELCYHLRGELCQMREGAFLWSGVQYRGCSPQ